MWPPEPWQIALAVLLDRLLGDPRWLPHPARIAGGLCVRCEKPVVALLGRSLPAGLLLLALVLAGTLALYGFIWWLLLPLHLAPLWETFVIYQSIAARDMDIHVHAILQAFRKRGIPAARKRLSWIVGRDTSRLDESGISRAAIESVAESTVDGFLSPLFWTLLAGAPGALVYRTVNTLDSMIGHRDEHYERLGKPAARLDDILNVIPARLCAFASWLTHGFPKPAPIIREARTHASPSAGWPEASIAHALPLRLGGGNTYDGQHLPGPVFNPAAPAPVIGDLPRALRWMWRIVLVSVLASLAVASILDVLL